MRGTEQQAAPRIDALRSLLRNLGILDDAHSTITLRQDSHFFVRVALGDDLARAVGAFTATEADEFGVADLDEGVVDAVLVDVLY